jgi:hypothetical protein
MDIVDIVVEIKKIKDFEQINKEIQTLKELAILEQDIRIYKTLKRKKYGNS